MGKPDRHYFKWTITEILALEREYELLELSVQEIAIKHKRTSSAIIYKLIAEGMICGDDLVGEDDDEDDEDYSDDEDEADEEYYYGVNVDDDSDCEIEKESAEKKELDETPRESVYRYIFNSVSNYIFPTKVSFPNACDRE